MVFFKTYKELFEEVSDNEELFDLLIKIFDKNKIRKFGEFLLEECLKHSEFKFRTKLEYIDYSNMYSYHIYFNSSADIRYDISIDPRGFFITATDYLDLDPKTEEYRTSYAVNADMIEDLVTPNYCIITLKLFFKSLKEELYFRKEKSDIAYPIHKREEYWSKLTEKNPLLYPFLKDKLSPEYKKKYIHLGRAHQFGMFDYVR